jgi:putative ABC transport system permease protein
MLREFRFAARALGRWRLGAAAAVLTLAVAIGTATALAAFLRALLDPGAEVPDVARVGRIYAASPPLRVERGPVSFVEFQAILAHASAFESVAAYAATGVTLDAASPADITSARYVSPEFFPLMRARPAAGRIFGPADADAPVAIVSERLWRSRLQGRPIEHVAITVDGTRREVVGVLPAAFSYSSIELDADVWLPLGRGVRDAPAVVSVIGRLRHGATWPAAGAELDRLARRGGSSQWTLRAIALGDDLRMRARSGLALTTVPALVVLLIGCVNVAALLMARGVQRHAELSLRQALGATRRRIARDLFLEHATLAAAGAAGGAAIAFALVRALSAAFAPVNPQVAERMAAGPALLPLAALCAVAACALSGVLPSIWLSNRKVVHWLRGLPPGRVRLAGYSARDLVVFVELACASVLVIAAAMWLHLFAELQRVTLGFPAAQIVGVRVPDTAADEVSRRMAGISGVDGVTRISAPLGGRGSASVADASVSGGPPVRAAVVPVGDRFVETLGLPIVRGRSFGAGEIPAHARTAVLSESAARALFGRADPLGAIVTLTRRTGYTRVEVIGICRDAVNYGALMTSGLAQPDVYVPYEPLTGEAFLLARVTADARAMLRPIAAAAHIDTLTRQPQPVVLGDDTRFVPGESLMMVRAFGAFALIALLLAGSGIFAVISHSVAVRAREFGIRMALGAARPRLLRLVLSREAPLMASALAIGMLFTVAATRVLFPDLIAINARSAATWLSILGVCGGVAAGACALATWGVARRDPSAVLRRS